jgi:hypothetical protein
VAHLAHVEPGEPGHSLTNAKFSEHLASPRFSRNVSDVVHLLFCSDEILLPSLCNGAGKNQGPIWVRSTERHMASNSLARLLRS